jgi:hypothetical protein
MFMGSAMCEAQNKETKMSATHNQVSTFIANQRTAKLRELLRREFGARKYRLTADGEVHVYGVMPNTSNTGWFLKGSRRSVCAEYGLL